MPEEIGLFEAIYSQRAIRYFKSDPIPDELILKLIEAATKGPSGTNRQPWSFVVVRDGEAKSKIAEYYLKSWNAAYGGQNSSPANISERVRSSADHLARTMQDVPVLIFPCIEHDGSPATLTRGSSIYPAVQNILLAARGLGLGSVITTLHKRYEQEIKGLLNIPDNVETAALLPVGYPAEGHGYGPTRRRPASELTYWDKWGVLK
jgi:nitroreductase